MEQFTRMKLVVLVTILSAGVSAVGTAQPPSGKLAEAYAQFLLGRHLEGEDELDGAIAAYKRASQFDPRSADILAEMAGLYMRQNRLDDAIAAADQALKIDAANREAHRVLGIVYATLAENRRGNGQRTRSNNPQTGTANENLTKAVQHLEQALAQPIGEPDPNVRAVLSRVYIAVGQFDKAILLLTDLVNQEPGWNDGPTLLAEAFAGAGRNDDATEGLERT